MKSKTMFLINLFTISLFFIYFTSLNSFALAYSIDLENLIGTYNADHTPIFGESFDWDVEFENAGGQIHIHDFGEPLGPILSVKIEYTGVVQQWPSFIDSESNIYELSEISICRGWWFKHLLGEGYTGTMGWGTGLRQGEGEISAYYERVEYQYGGEWYRNVSSDGEFTLSETIVALGEDFYFSEGVESGVVAGLLAFWLDKERVAKNIDYENWETIYQGLTLNQPGIIDVEGATLTITPVPEPVPEPSTILLVATGLIGLVGFRRKFKK